MEAVGLGFVVVHDGILKQGVKSLDRLDLLVFLRHRHSLTMSRGPTPRGKHLRKTWLNRGKNEVRPGAWPLGF